MSVVFRKAFLFGALTSLAASSALAQTGDPKAEPSYSAVGTGISYYNTPNRSHTIITAREEKMLGSVTVTLKKPADVLVQFTDQLATVEKTGCPCSVRAALSVDGGPGVIVRRVNLSAGSGEGTAYVPDRQSADGSFVFPLPAGKHEIRLLVQQIEGSAPTLYSFYANIQAIPFEKK